MTTNPLPLKLPEAHRVASWVVSASLLLMLCFLLFVVVTMAWPYNQLPVFQMVVEGTPHAGDDVLVRLDYCKTHDWTASQMRWSIQNSIAIPLDWQAFTVPTGCHSIRMRFDLSHKVPAGLYVLQQEVYYDPWPWRTVSYIHRSQPFEVLAAQ